MGTPTVLTNGTIVTGFAQLDNCALYIDENGLIGDIFNMQRLGQKEFPENTLRIDVQNAYIIPGMIDSHIHGIGGFGTEDCSPESILGMSERLADYGVSAFLPTVYTNLPEDMIKAEKAIVQAMGNEKGAKIMGINLEGPFISPKRINAQNPEGVHAVDTELFEQLIKAGQGHVVCMTVAPELKNMRELALLARRENIVLLAGHTDATYENMMEGIQCGILHTTHFYNAMSPLHHRNPGCVGAVLIHEEMQCEIICDGVHVHPELVKLLLREKPVSNIVMVTDSLKPTKQKIGPFYANGMKAVLSEQGVWVSENDPTLFLGSALTLQKAVKNVVGWGIPLSNAVQMTSTNPARIYGFRNMGMLIPDYTADVTVLDKTFQLKGLFVNGKLIRDRFD
ncbi:MAG: N-acetylglucosamine-6-phosphate deacetylase [Sphaerochaetaceae bacterium]|jgi:N-acetylglucosamine-6-phosphate deacetylase